MPNPNSIILPKLAYLYLATAMLLVGANISLARALLLTIPVLIFALLRFALAVAVMLPLYFKPALRPRTWADWRTIFWQAFFGTFGFTLCMAYGLQSVNAVTAGLITGAIPAAAALLAWWLLHEKLSARTAFSIALAIFGVALLALSKNDAAASSAWGMALVLGAVFCEATYVVLSKRLMTRMNPLSVTAWAHLIGLILIFPIAAHTAWRFDWAQISAVDWLWLLWYSLAASIFSFWLWLRGTQTVPANVAGVFTALMPLSAAACAVAFLHEQFLWQHAAACALIILAIVLETKK